MTKKKTAKPKVVRPERGRLARILESHGRAPPPPSDKKRGTEPAWVARLGPRKRKHSVLLRMNDSEKRDLEMLILHHGAANASALLRHMMRLFFQQTVQRPIEMQVDEELMTEAARRAREERIEYLKNEIIRGVDKNASDPGEEAKARAVREAWTGKNMPKRKSRWQGADGKPL